MENGTMTLLIVSTLLCVFMYKYETAHSELEDVKIELLKSQDLAEMYSRQRANVPALCGYE